jgi:hypothetical protein
VAALKEVAMMMDVYVSSIPHGGPGSDCCRWCDSRKVAYTHEVELETYEVADERRALLEEQAARKERDRELGVVVRPRGWKTAVALEGLVSGRRLA